MGAFTDRPIHMGVFVHHSAELVKSSMATFTITCSQYPFSNRVKVDILVTEILRIRSFLTAAVTDKTLTFYSRYFVARRGHAFEIANRKAYNTS